MNVDNIIFSVIIPTCHRNDLLAECLERLSKQDFALNDFEIIVTDDGEQSTAEAMLKKKFPAVKWTKGPGKGPAANRNHGAKKALGKWLVFTDDDCLPNLCWLKEFSAAIKFNNDVKVFEGRTYPDRSKMAFNEVAPINETGGHMPSCNFMICEELYWELGGFDENFKFYFEDMDFSYRIKKLGLPSVFVPTASVCHPWRIVDAIKFWRNRKFYKESYWKFIVKDEELFRSHNPIFFMKQFIKDLIFDTIKNLYKYRGQGIIYNLSHRMVHLELFFRSLFTSNRKYNKLRKKIVLE